jgi:hypothetical protein
MPDFRLVAYAEGYRALHSGYADKANLAESIKDMMRASPRETVRVEVQDAETMRVIKQVPNKKYVPR